MGKPVTICQKIIKYVSNKYAVEASKGYIFYRLSTPFSSMKINKAMSNKSNINYFSFYPTALKGCRDIVFTRGVWMGGQAGAWPMGKSLSGLYLKN